MPAQASGTGASQASTPDRPGAQAGTTTVLGAGGNASGSRASLLARTPPAALWLVTGAAALVVVVIAAALLRDGVSLSRLEAASLAERATPSSSGLRRPVAPKPSDAVPADELATATAGGVLALEALASRYPKDPAIFRALMLRHALPPPYHAAALAAAKRLLELDPGAAADDDVERIVSSAAGGPPEVASAALDLMASGMGSHGADLLYELAVGTSALKERAAKRLAEAAVQGRATPALRIAHELRVAPSCKARQALLARATTDGDRRAIDVLAPLITSKGKGCGFLGMSRCTAACASIAGEIKAAIQAIEARTGPSPRAADAPASR
ncbi:hypothetical protein [Sorangium atrum]|uniref:HEAT repeat domain-containing protein n=1 Tax=Sorangium atrum TaxID=2995308 RepID=A0ABT5C662_9BACT|nr:hypothetical protein [Sorangium aterium]MDC0681917.1 hypothetical protein [Sorangium aterium]